VVLRMKNMVTSRCRRRVPGQPGAAAIRPDE
jgi:hypothetical protein